MIENQNSYPMNLLVTLDRNYVPQLNVMPHFLTYISCTMRGCQPPI